jgi:predicted RNA-binding Zn-ribbon protein involved in translation (DUF1610 family)
MQSEDPLVVAVALAMLIGPVLLACILCSKCCCRKSGSAIEEAKKADRIRTESLQRIAREYKTKHLSAPSEEVQSLSSSGSARGDNLKSLEVEKPRTPVSKKGIKALRGGEFIGNHLRFKVEVLNESRFAITDVTVYLISYPREALLLDSEDDDVFYPKIEPKGFRSPSFEFLPTQDCVRGEIIAGISYIDITGKIHNLVARPFIIRAVCDLLQPDVISPDSFVEKLESLDHGELAVKVDEWTPEEMHKRTLRILNGSNFHEVASEINEKDGIIQGKISGWAKGKYTGKNVGVEVFISGLARKRGARCGIRVSSEDKAMILPAMDDLKKRLTAWLCPMCGSKLVGRDVESLKTKHTICCPFCGASVGRYPKELT